MSTVDRVHNVLHALLSSSHPHKDANYSQTALEKQALC